MQKRWVKAILVPATLALVLAGCSGNAKPAAAPAPAAVPTASADNADLAKRVKDLEDFIAVQQKSINPGLGTVMIEYSQRMAKLWFAGQAEAWDEAKYQLLEMTEIQETGEITRPKRAEALKTFEGKFLDPLGKTIESKNKAEFVSAYNKAVEGCNQCHTNTKSDDFPNGYGWVKFQVPKVAPIDYQDLTAK